MSEQSPHDIADSEIDIELRSPAEAAARAVVLAAVLRRVALDEAIKTDPFEAASEAFDLREWLRDQHLTDAMTPREQSLVERPPGSLMDNEIRDESWLGEALAALAWALGTGELPVPGVPARLDAILDALPTPWESTASWINTSQLRPEPLIARERERCELWHWRASVEELWRTTSSAERGDYDRAIRDIAGEAAAAGLLDARSHTDFTIDGRTVRSLRDAAIDELVALSAERLRALNWLCGFGRSWDDVPLEI